MKNHLLKVLSLSACCFVSVLQTEAHCMDHDWDEEVNEAIRWKNCGQSLVDQVHNRLREEPYTYLYKSGSLSDLERKLEQKEFHQISTPNPAVAAMQQLITAALMQDTNCKSEVAKFVSDKAFEKLSVRINWDNVSTSGPIISTIITVWTPIKDRCHLLFSADLSCYQLDVSYGGVFGYAGYKTFKMHKLQGTYGVLYFSTDPAKF
jgi:hypothetical protein